MIKYSEKSVKEHSLNLVFSHLKSFKNAISCCYCLSEIFVQNN
jgi:hypothetical protein